eukprot:scaffold7740_cov112-Isochrysis_galbana.AAC.10
MERYFWRSVNTCLSACSCVVRLRLHAEYRRKARVLDASPAVQAHNGGSTTAVAGALAAFRPVRGLAFGQYGEASADVHSLLKAAASTARAVACRIGGIAAGRHARLKALYTSNLRRAWGVTIVREMARHRLARIPLIAAALGTRLSQTFAPASRAAGWDVEAAPVGPPGLRALHA